MKNDTKAIKFPLTECNKQTTTTGNNYRGLTNARLCIYFISLRAIQWSYTTPGGLINDRSMCPTVNDCALMVVACHSNGDGQKPITTTAQKDRKKINHLKSAIDRNQNMWRPGVANTDNFLCDVTCWTKSLINKISKYIFVS